MRFVCVAATHGEVTQSLQGNLLGMRRTADTCQVLVWYVINLMEIFRADKVLIRHDTLDGCDDELVADPCLEFLEMVLQVRRWGNEYECIVVLHYLVDVGREEYLIHIESC